MFPICPRMDQRNQYGLYLFSKARTDQCVLKELLQFLRVQSPGKSVNFAYVEAGSSLIPHLTLWENLHVVVGGQTWRDFVAGLNPDWKSLASLITHPDSFVSEATAWECLITGLLKALIMNSPNILVDMNEELHSSLNLQNFKKILQNLTSGREIFLATSNTSLWLDSCHSLVTRNGYLFEVEAIGGEKIKRKTA